MNYMIQRFLAVLSYFKVNKLILIFILYLGVLYIQCKLAGGCQFFSYF